MTTWQLIFFISCSIIIYNYAGYALLVYCINRLLPRKKEIYPNFYPSVSFIVAEYNEEDFIERKLANSLEQRYPKEKIEFIFVTDGSTDSTDDKIKRVLSLQLLHKPERKGKSAAINRAVQYAKNDILIFSDANTVLNKDAVQNICRHYFYKEVGGVAGEKKILFQYNNNDDEVGAGEGLYWKYESFLKKLDSDFYSVVGAAGELFSVRKKYFEPVPDSVILDDFVISLKVAQKGYRIIYEPDAYAIEPPSLSLKDEQKRKVRIAAGGFQAIVMLRSLFFIWKHPKLSFLYISHRVLRWTLSPLCIITAFVSNAILFTESGSMVWKLLFFLQIIFYLMAFTARFFSSNKLWYKCFNLSYYFVFMNISVVQGFVRFLLNKQSAVWEKVKRS